MHGFYKRTRVGKCDKVIKYSAPMFSSFSQWFADIYAIIRSNMILSFINIRKVPRED